MRPRCRAPVSSQAPESTAPPSGSPAPKRGLTGAVPASQPARKPAAPKTRSNGLRPKPHLHRAKEPASAHAAGGGRVGRRRTGGRRAARGLGRLGGCARGLTCAAAEEAAGRRAGRGRGGGLNPEVGRRSSERARSGARRPAASGGALCSR